MIYVKIRENLMQPPLIANCRMNCPITDLISKNYFQPLATVRDNNITKSWSFSGDGF